MLEPATVIVQTAPKFNEVIGMGHSRGVADIFASVGAVAEKHPKAATKITKIISSAGYLGRPESDPTTELWHGTKLKFDELIDSELTDAKDEDNLRYVQNREKFAASVRKTAEILASTKIPENVQQVVVAAPYDKIIAMPVIKIKREADGKEVVQTFDYPGQTRRSLVIGDRTQPEQKTHKMTGIRSQTLLRLLEISISGRGPHFVTVKEKLPKEERGRAGT